ncbi:hypothetical protein [Streptomyces sp. NPDC000880]
MRALGRLAGEHLAAGALQGVVDVPHGLLSFLEDGVVAVALDVACGVHALLHQVHRPRHLSKVSRPLLQRLFAAVLLAVAALMLVDVFV